MFKIIKFIYNHPLNKEQKLKAIVKFFKWQIASRIFNVSFVIDWIQGSKLVVSQGMTGATGNLYVGLMEYEDMSFLLHYLGEDDLFFDIGANVGVYSVLASKVCSAKTISIEPLPNTYEKLLDNIYINRLQNVITENIGLSFEKSKLFFTTDKDTMNSVALDKEVNTQEVYVDTLDHLVTKYGIPKVMKIDVEGYETNVLKGAQETLKSGTVEVIILELNGSGEKFGFYDDDIHKLLLDLGYNSFTYNPFERKLIALEKYGTHNTIYIKNDRIDSIQNKLSVAPFFELNGLKI